MRVRHEGGTTFIQGTVAEQAVILAWIEEALKLDRTLWVAADECDEDETSYSVVSRWIRTQEERQDIFREAKKAITARR